VNGAVLVGGGTSHSARTFSGTLLAARAGSFTLHTTFN
jgi:hypothetical protein